MGGKKKEWKSGSAINPLFSFSSRFRNTDDMKDKNKTPLKIFVTDDRRYALENDLFEDATR